jgi:hypothetical protein
MIDYAGVANRWIVDKGGTSLGTTVTGTVTEQAAANGRAQITVRLRTTRALTFAVSGCDVGTSPLLFGYRPQEVLTGATPSLGDSEFTAVYLAQAPGLPLKDFVQVLFFPEFGEFVEQTQINASASGKLRSAFGVPDGTPGRLSALYRDLILANGRYQLVENINISQ